MIFNTRRLLVVILFFMITGMAHGEHDIFAQSSAGNSTTTGNSTTGSTTTTGSSNSDDSYIHDLDVNLLGTTVVLAVAYCFIVISIGCVALICRPKWFYHPRAVQHEAVTQLDEL